MMYNLSTTLTPSFALLDHACAFFESFCAFSFESAFSIRIVKCLGDFGNHTFKKTMQNGGYHSIKLLGGRKVYALLRTLFHELTHAMQREGIGAQRFYKMYEAETQVHGYDLNKFEVEAREISAELIEEFFSLPSMQGIHYFDSFDEVAQQFDQKLKSTDNAQVTIQS